MAAIDAERYLEDLPGTHHATAAGNTQAVISN